MADEKELKLTAKDILTSVPKSPLIKDLFWGSGPGFHNCTTESLVSDPNQVTQYTLDFSFSFVKLGSWAK